MRLPLDFTTLLQAMTWLAALIPQLLNDGMVPDEYKRFAIGLGALLSVFLHVYAGKRNPNGTPAALPYLPDGQELLSAAEAAYEAYRAQAGGRSLATGAVIPPWAGLMPTIREAWTAAAGAAKAHK